MAMDTGFGMLDITLHFRGFTSVSTLLARHFMCKKVVLTWDDGVEYSLDNMTEWIMRCKYRGNSSDPLGSNKARSIPGESITPHRRLAKLRRFCGLARDQRHFSTARRRLHITTAQHGQHNIARAEAATGAFTPNISQICSLNTTNSRCRRYTLLLRYHLRKPVTPPPTFEPMRI